MKKPVHKLINSSFAKKILQQIVIRIAIVIALSALVSYFHIFVLLEEQVQDSLQKYIIERGEKESIIFTEAEYHHQKLSREFLELWIQDIPFDSQRYSQLFVPRSDGTMRLSEAAFYGYTRADGSSSRYLSAYIGSKAPVDDPEFQRKLLLSYDLLDRFAPGWTVRDYPNLYISMPENVNMVYWPGIPWGSQAGSSLDVNAEEWVYVANATNNPARVPVWTGLYYDQTADEWMVSLETPVDFNSEHLINVGHDILLNTLFERVFNDKLEGTYNFLFRQDGRIIAHPQMVEELRQSAGVLHVENTGNLELARMIELIRQQSSLESRSIIVEDQFSDALLAVTRIEGPDWYFVTVYPKSLLASTALSIAYIVGIIGFVSLLVELLIFFRIIKLQVLEPIQSFGWFTDKVTNREYESLCSSGLQVFKNRDDEIGELADAMDNMAIKIQVYESELEKLVDEQMREVRDTNLKLRAESDEKAEIVSLLQTIARDVSGLQGNEYFNTMSQFMAESLDADFVLISRLSEDRQNIISLSACLHRKIIENIVYPIQGTPCEMVINHGPQLYDGNVKEMFPSDQGLVDLNLDSFAGTPLYDSKYNCIGHLAVMKKHRFVEADKVRLVVDSVSSRASSELLRQVNEEVILRQATTDSLTGLLNRAALMENLKQLIARSDRNHQSLAVAFIDLDNFKPVNDRFGHSAGDKLLEVLSKRLNECVRKADLVGRLGGDEFVVVLDNFEGVDSSVSAIEKIRSQLTREISIENVDLPITCSIGIAVYPGDGATCDELINNADRAMYRAKELGKNCIQFFTAEMNSQQQRHQQIEFDLRQSISENRFSVFYQPQLCLRRNKIVKFEALVRWQHPEKGLIPPDEFIPVAEKTGQILEIGEIVLCQVGRDFKNLKELFPELVAISVNFSARQFRDSNIVSCLRNVIESNQLGYECIEIEITESVFIDVEDNVALDIFYQLRDLGFKIALDDFGTGYSSLAYLKQFPVDILKIDRSFIRDLTIDAQSKALVSSIIDLAQNFQLKVVAEGIETEAQQEALKQIDCDLGQGFLYAAPMALNDILQDNLRVDAS
ncbi:MAG: EAL domain-containing protein [Gammaproteobacteria bacterium]|nr:EAL domain-containing protein [Gammaproteobacteria bacterium]